MPYIISDVASVNTSLSNSCVSLPSLSIPPSILTLHTPSLDDTLSTSSSHYKSSSLSASSSFHLLSSNIPTASGTHEENFAPDSSQHSVSTVSTDPSLSTYKSIITPLKVAEAVTFAANFEERGSTSEERNLSGAPSFKSEFAKRLSASSSLLNKGIPGDEDTQKVLQFQNENLANGGNQSEHIPSNQSKGTSLVNGLPSKQDEFQYLSDVSGSVHETENSSMNLQFLLDENPSSKETVLQSHPANDNFLLGSLPKSSGNVISGDALANSVSLSLFKNNELDQRKDLSELIRSSCLKFSEICSSLVDESNQKLHKVLSEDADFSDSNFNFNSSFEKMFDSVVEDDSEDFEREDSDLQETKKVQFNVSDSESSPKHLRKNDFKETETFQPLTNGLLLEPEDQEDSSSFSPQNTRQRGKVCEDEMDVDYFLDDEPISKEGSFQKSLLSDKLVSIEKNEEEAFIANDLLEVSKGRAFKRTGFASIPEDDEITSVKSESSLSELGNKCSPAKNLRPTTLPLFSDLSQKELGLQSPKRSTTAASYKKLLKLSPYQPSSRGLSLPFNITDGTQPLRTSTLKSLKNSKNDDSSLDASFDTVSSDFSDAKASADTTDLLSATCSKFSSDQTTCSSPLVVDKQKYIELSPSKSVIPLSPIRQNSLPSQSSKTTCPIVPSSSQSLSLNSPMCPNPSQQRAAQSPIQQKLGITSICGSPLRATRTMTSPSIIDENKPSRSLPSSPMKVQLMN